MRGSRRSRAGSTAVAAGLLLGLAPALATAAAVPPLAVQGPAVSPSPSVTPTGAAPAGRTPGDPVGGPRLGETGTIVEQAPGLPGLPKDLRAKSWLVADLDSGMVLAARDPHRRNPPASTLKTLTALTLIPTLPAATRVRFTAAEAKAIEQADGLSTAVGLEVDRAYPARRLFEAMLVLSANDAAEALAGAAPGGRAATLAGMNAQAAHLQARDTQAGTPSGLDADGQFTSAYDLGLIARAALAQPDFRGYTGSRCISLTGSKGVFGGCTHNRLLNSYPGAYAGKDGYTSLAGQVWWGAAERGGRHLFVSVVDAGYTPVTEEIRLLDWGFAAATRARPVGRLVEPMTPAASPDRVDAPAAPGAATVTAAGAAVAPTGLPRRGGGIPWLWLLLGGAGAAAGAAVLRRRSGASAVSLELRSGSGRHAAGRRPVPGPRPDPAELADPLAMTETAARRVTRPSPPPPQGADLSTGAVKLVRPGSPTGADR